MATIFHPTLAAARASAESEETLLLHYFHSPG